jgi:hypothetical protein
MQQSPVDVTLPGAWEPGLKILLDAAKEYGVSAVPYIHALHVYNL